MFSSLFVLPKSDHANINHGATRKMASSYATINTVDLFSVKGMVALVCDLLVIPSFLPVVDRTNLTMQPALLPVLESSTC